MTTKSTLMWRALVLGLLATVVPVGIYSYEQGTRVDTERMLDVSVSIKTISHVRTDKVGDSVWNPGTGSGFLVSRANCEIWTNHHVIADAAVIEVYPRKWSDAQGIPARVINSTPRADIAVLRMQSCDGMPEAPIGDSSTLRPGDETYAVGNPLGLNPDSISRGIISHTERYASGPIPYLQTDAALNRGNSGGALFNRKGEVIGVNTAIASTSGSNAGIGYALPVNLVRSEIDVLRSGPPSWGDAGISKLVAELSPDEAAIFKVPNNRGAIIITDDPKEGAAAAKLKSRDVIYGINNAAVSRKDEALRVINNHNPGDAVTFHLIREGKPVTVEVTLDEGWKEGKAREPEYYAGHLGMTVEMWHHEDGERGQFTQPVIAKVQSLGPAHKAHISSSQKTLGRRGPFVFPYLLDVKTITGLVFDGAYYPVEDLETLEGFAAIAARADIPLLLEIEKWMRPNPMKVEEPLKRMGKAFYRLSPTLTTAHAPTGGETEKDSETVAAAKATTAVETSEKDEGTSAQESDESVPGHHAKLDQTRTL